MAEVSTSAQKRRKVLERSTSFLVRRRRLEIPLSARLDAKILSPGPSRRGWHRLQLAAECLQKYAWTYRGPEAPGDAYQKAKLGDSSPALVKGSLLHLALAQHYRRMQAFQQGEDPDDWVDPVEAIHLKGQAEGVKDGIITLIEDVYHAYRDHYIEDKLNFKVTGVEELAEVMVGPHLLTGRRDLTYEDNGGRIWVCDHKSSSRLTRSHREYYLVSGQLLGYSYMAKDQYGDRFAGMIVNLVQVTSEVKFERIELPRSPNLEARFEEIVNDIEQSIERLDQEGRPFDAWPKAINELTCYSRYGSCPFLDKCRFGKDAKKAGGFEISLDW